VTFHQGEVDQQPEAAMRKLSAASRKKISESMRKAWAARRAKQAGGRTAVRSPAMAKLAVSGNHANQAIAGAVSAIKRLTLADIRGLAHRKGSVEQVTELEQLAIDLKELLTASAKTR
jgi:hypothetical protein